MDKKRRNKKNWGNQKSGDKTVKNHYNQPAKQKNQQNNSSSFKKNPNLYENEAAEQEKRKLIQEFKQKQVICSKCGQVIEDVASAFSDKQTGNPVHFECVLSGIQASETLGENEKIAYIGQGRFGVLYFENPRDQRHFVIKKIIDCENKDQKPEWRTEIGELYSKVN